MSQQRSGPPLPLAQASPQGPPIAELVRFLGRVLAVGYGLLSRTTVTLALSLLAPLSLLYGPVGYLLAPLFVLLQVLFDVCVRGPYALAQAVAENVYPVYVFVGAACICAVVVGASARVLSAALRALLLGPPSVGRKTAREREREGQGQGQGQADGKGKSAMKASVGTGPARTRVRKRVSIKEEGRDT